MAQVNRISWRDMDASRLGFEKGVTPFADHPAEIELPTPIDGVPTASLSTGSDVVGGAAWDGIEADLVDMETFAVVRACQRFDVPVIGLRGVSDGPGNLREIGGWAKLLERLDEHLAKAVDLLPEALNRLQGERRQGGLDADPTPEDASGSSAVLCSYQLKHPCWSSSISTARSLTPGPGLLRNSCSAPTASATAR